MAFDVQCNIKASTPTFSTLERHVFTSLGLHLPMYSTLRNESGRTVLLLGRRSRKDVKAPAVLTELQSIIETKVLPAVGIINVIYRKAQKGWNATGFLSGAQTIATAFHNVLPIQYLDEEEGALKWDWPDVLFSTNYDGSFAVWDAWHTSGGDPPNLWVDLSFSEELLQKWQGASLDNPQDCRYFSSDKHDMIELCSPIPYSVYFDLSPVEVEFNYCICVGYPGEPDPEDQNQYNHTPAYNPTEAYYRPDIKTVSFGKIAGRATDTDILFHTCSTVRQNSGSPILLLSSLSTVPVRVAAMHVCGEKDDSASRNYNLALSNSYWRVP